MHTAEKRDLLGILLILFLIIFFGRFLCCREKWVLPTLSEPVVSVWAQTLVADGSGIEAVGNSGELEEGYFPGNGTNDSVLLLGAGGVLLVFLLIMIRLYVHSRMWKP